MGGRKEGLGDESGGMEKNSSKDWATKEKEWKRLGGRKERSEEGGMEENDRREEGGRKRSRSRSGWCNWRLASRPALRR